MSDRLEDILAKLNTVLGPYEDKPKPAAPATQAPQTPDAPATTEAAGEVDVMPLVESLIHSIAGQESAHGRNARPNNRTGARGVFQIMPGNIAQFSRETIGRAVTIQEYDNNPELQYIIGSRKLMQYYSEALQRAGGDPMLAAQYTANKWYSGRFEPHRGYTRRPRPNEPSPAEYWEQVRNRMGAEQQAFAQVAAPTDDDGLVTADEAARIGGGGTTGPAAPKQDTQLADHFVNETRRRVRATREAEAAKEQEKVRQDLNALIRPSHGQDQAPESAQAAQPEPRKSRFERGQERKNLTPAEIKNRMAAGNLREDVAQPDFSYRRREQEAFETRQASMRAVADAMDKAGAPGSGSLLLRFAAAAPVTAAITRAGVQAANAATLNVASAIAPEAYGNIMNTVSSGVQGLDEAADVVGPTVGGLVGLKGVQAVVQEIIPGASAMAKGVLTFAASATPENVIRTVTGEQTVTQGLAKIGVNAIAGAAQVKAEQAIPSMVKGVSRAMAPKGTTVNPAVPETQVQAAVAGALSQAPLGPAQAATEAAIDGREITGEELLSSALISGGFGAIGGRAQARARNKHFNSRLLPPSSEPPAPTPKGLPEPPLNVQTQQKPMSRAERAKAKQQTTEAEYEDPNRKLLPETVAKPEEQAPVESSTQEADRPARAIEPYSEARAQEAESTGRRSEQTAPEGEASVQEATTRPVDNTRPDRAADTQDAVFEDVKTETNESDAEFEARLNRQHDESAPTTDKNTLHSTIFGIPIPKKQPGKRNKPEGGEEKRKKPWTDPDPLVEERMQAARNTPKPGWFERTKQWMKETAVKFTSEYPMLRRGAATAELRAWTSRVFKAPQAADANVAMRIRQIFTKLDAEQQQLVQEKIIRDDLMEDLKIQSRGREGTVITERRVMDPVTGKPRKPTQGEPVIVEVMYDDGTTADIETTKIIAGAGKKGERVTVAPEVKLPFGFTPESLQVSHKSITDRLAADKDASQAVADWHRYVRSVADKHATLYEAATGQRLALDRKQYFRHQVLKYIEEQQANATGKKFVNRRGYYKHRKGSEEDYSLDFMDVMPQTLRQMEADNAKLEFLLKLKTKYSDPAVAQAKKAAIAAGEKMAHVYTAENIKNAKLAAEAAGKSDWKEFLPQEPQNWTKYLPEGYVEFKPGPEQNYFRTYAPQQQKLAEILSARGKEIGVSINDLRRVITVEDGLKIYVPEGDVKNHLDWMVSRKENNRGAQLLRKGWGGWKWWMLNNPVGFIKVQTRNMLTDVSRFAHNPKALRRVMPAFREISDLILKRKSATPELKKWMEMGGFADLYNIREDVALQNNIKILRNHFEKQQNPMSRLNFAKWYGKATKTFTEVREATFRYAHYLEYLDQMKQNGGKPLNYGASNRDEINAMRDIHDKAYLLANDLLVNYDQVSVSGQFLARYVYPFFRFKEGNFRTTLGTFRNDIQDVRDLTGSARIGKAVLKKMGNHGLRIAIKSPLLAMQVGKWYVASSALDILARMWNNIGANEEDEALMPDVREASHITLPYGLREGTSLYFNRISGFDDALGMVGIEGLNFGLEQVIFDGKAPGEVVKDMFRAERFWNNFANNWGQGSGPWQTAVEIISGKSYFPDVLNPRQIRDPMEAVFASMHMRDIYRAITDKPNTHSKDFVAKVFGYVTDHKKASFDRIRSKAAEFVDRKGAGGAYITPKNNAAYYFKEALKLDDMEAAKVWLHRYMTLHLNKKEEGSPDYREITQATKLTPGEMAEVSRGLEASLRALDPLAQMNAEMRAEFIASLDEQDTKDLQTGYEWLNDLVTFGQDKVATFRPDVAPVLGRAARRIQSRFENSKRQAVREKHKKVQAK